MLVFFDLENLPRVRRDNVIEIPGICIYFRAVGAGPACHSESLTLTHRRRLKAEAEFPEGIFWVVFALCAIAKAFANLSRLHAKAVVDNPDPGVIAIEMNIDVDL